MLERQATNRKREVEIELQRKNTREGVRSQEKERNGAAEKGKMEGAPLKSTNVNFIRAQLVCSTILTHRYSDPLG